MLPRNQSTISPEKMCAGKAQNVLPSIATGCCIDVFLSFRGRDTRTNFADHLYNALVKIGFCTFRDSDGIALGESMKSELQRAIQVSRISIVILSKNYAFSRWCLDELVQIMERKRADGHYVLPVFYKVDPYHVRHQIADYAAAFVEHGKSETETVQRWRTALREVGYLKGMVLGNRPEVDFIKDIVKEVHKKLDKPVLHVAPYLVGRGDLVDEINQWVQDGANDVGIATISGIGGVGKTTIAKVVYNTNHGKFDGSSFLFNIGEVNEANGLICLQQQLLSDLLMERDVVIKNSDDGIMKIKEVICWRKVLLVLDDVDEADKFDTIIGMRKWFCPGSKIIMTTRHKQLLKKAHGPYAKFQVRGLSHKESLQLLSWHAFGEENPAEGYGKCLNKVAQHCGGVPLALEVIGSSLSGKTVDMWESALKELEVVMDVKVQKILVMGYKVLQHDRYKSIFLDIACFFVGVDKDYTIRILNGLGFSAAIGIEHLVDCCLLSVDFDNKIRMHPLLRNMGREIVRQESVEDPGKRSRLWHSGDVLNVLRCGTGTKNIKGLSLDFPMSEGNQHVSHITSNSLKRSHVRTAFGLKRFRLNLSAWIPIQTCSRFSNDKLKEDTLRASDFKKMRGLQLLQLKYVELDGSYQDIPKGLVWLSWHGFPLESIPEDFHLDNLVALDMRDSKLKSNWKCGQVLRQLKFLDLSDCCTLSKTPDFVGLLNLERLILKNCINLVEIDETIGNLIKLVSLDLSGCRKLRKLSKKISMLVYLEELVLSGCSMVEELPVMELAAMGALSVLHLGGISLNQLKSAIRDPRKFVMSHRQSWYSILASRLFGTKVSKAVTSVVLTWSSLVELHLPNCSLSENVTAIDFSRMCSLEKLDLSSNPFRNLPKGISSLKYLQTLYVWDCTELQVIPELPPALKKLDARYCESLEKVINLPTLHEELNCMFCGCIKLVRVGGLFRKTNSINPDTEFLDPADCLIPDSILLGQDPHKRLKVSVYDSFSETEMTVPSQVLRDGRVSSIFIRRHTYPLWGGFCSQSPLFTFVLPPSEFGCKISGLHITIGIGGDIPENYEARHPFIRFTNITKGVKCKYIPSVWGLHGGGKDMLWLTCWELNDSILEVGDSVTISFEAYFPDMFKEWSIIVIYEKGGDVGLGRRNSL